MCGLLNFSLHLLIIYKFYSFFFVIMLIICIFAANFKFIYMEVGNLSPVVKVVFLDGIIMYFGTTLDTALSDISKYIRRQNVVSITFSKSYITEL